MFRAKVVDAAADSVTVEATGTQDKLSALLGMLESFGITRDRQVRGPSRSAAADVRSPIAACWAEPSES